ncbi:DUF3558 domain-containing protein [Nocardia noduli]|uniref:DUF3558 domain-containing protein n=1 Tax=Nocardia noduli TaxID=2815722 RepID=UPI001C237286|nr:DUF3558 domain-containing protein [Nocardia noduli]
MRVLAGVGLVVGALVAVGCGSPGGDPGTSSAVHSANGLGLEASPPESYDPCADVPQSALTSERLRAVGIANADALGGVQWRGCQWKKVNGYTVSIRMTNMTLPFVRKNFYDGGRDAMVAGRPATIARRDAARRTEVCTINVQIEGGSIEFDLDNPPSNAVTGTIDTCELGSALAEKVVQTLPAGA